MEARRPNNASVMKDWAAFNQSEKKVNMNINGVLFQHLVVFFCCFFLENQIL